MAIGLKEEDLAASCRCDEHSLGGRVGKLDDRVIVSLEDHIKFNVALIDGHDTNDTRIVTDGSHPAFIQI